MAPPEDSPYQLLVEGSDDLNTIIHLMKRHEFDWDDETSIRPFLSARGGINGLLKDIPAFLRSAAYQRIGVVLDANSDLTARWTQVRDRAQEAGANLPDLPLPQGTTVSGRVADSRFGVWIMPDNQSLGALENFLGKLMPDADPIQVYAGEAVNEARRRGAKCQPKDHIKSVLHTWLAWQAKPGLPFGTALQAEIFEKDSDVALRFVAWFRNLFADPSPSPRSPAPSAPPPPPPRDPRNR